jgi:carboxyl-terminal processing protease
MLRFTKKISLAVLVLGVSWFGVTVGQSVTREVINVTAMAAAASSGTAASATTATSQQDRYENLELFQKVLHFVEANYVDPVKNKDLVYGAIKGMLETLDPHSNFLPPDVFKDMKIDTTGKFGGLGIEIGMKDSILTVIAPIEDTPAWKAGLKPNDRIVKIDNESTKGLTLVEAVSKMRGKSGSKVVLAVYRDGWEKIRDVPIVRDIIKIQSVKSEPLETGYGYVRLTSFNESAATDVKKAIDNLQKKTKLKGLVFDLRNNPGGLLDQAVDVSSLFIDSGIVVSTIGRNHDQKEVKYARKGQAFKDFPVAVLVNSSSASAAEIVTGALQDHHRAIIMGQPTFGKGSVQTVIELGPDLGLKLTIARYYTPSGRSIQDRGVQPDILLDEYDPKLLADAKRKGEVFRERDLKGHMMNPDGDEANGDEETTKTKAADYKKEELDSITKMGKNKGGKSKDKNGATSADDDDMSPIKMNPKEDYQVHEALNYLKSFDVFKKISLGGDADSTAAAKSDAATKSE